MHIITMPIIHMPIIPHAYSIRHIIHMPIIPHAYSTGILIHAYYYLLDRGCGGPEALWDFRVEIPPQTLGVETLIETGGYN